MDTSPPEIQQVNNSELVKQQIKDVMRSKFGLLQEEIAFPSVLKRQPSPQEDPSDIAFRREVERVLPGVLASDDKVLVIQNIATQHAVATTSTFLEAGLDTYFTFIPPNNSIRPKMMQGSYYHPERVMGVALANEDKIKEAKDKLEKDKLKGAVVMVDAHADYEDQNGEFDKFLPDDNKLEELGIKRVVLMGEFAPANAQGLTDRRLNKKEDWDKSHIYDYLRQLKAKGFPVSLIGIDTRQS